MRRVAINGGSGSGKSTLARRLHEVLDLPYVEIDSLQHGPGWQPRPTFLADVTRFVEGERWVIEYQYDAARPVILDRADTFVWLDLPTRQVMWQVLRRTLRRRWRNEDLGYGNREGPLWRVLVEREHIIRWAWHTRRWSAQRADGVRRDRPDLPVVRLRSRSAVDAWVDGLTSAGRPARPR
jgi:adenylate kinase family enzyme